MIVKGPATKLDFTSYVTGMMILDVGLDMATKDLLINRAFHLTIY